MSSLERLRPLSKELVIDCVRAAGLDVSDWSNIKGGEARASMNPAYCYNWSFVQPGKSVVLNLWYENLTERRGGVIEVSVDARDSAKRHARKGGKALWRKRATELDQAIGTAARSGIPIRAIINDGVRRKSDSASAKPSQVNARALDPLPWTVIAYDDKTGRGVLRRGDVDRGAVDQFESGSAENAVAERREVTGEAFVRDPAVRRRAIRRSGGKCEYCGTIGFLTKSGRYYIETHHVVPLGEGGPDTPANVAAICPGCHREAHHGSRASDIRRALLRLLRGR